MSTEHSDDTTPDDAAPGSGAGDAATSQAIPHLPKPKKPKKPKKSVDKPETDKADETDKGRVREVPDSGPAATSKQRRVEPVPPGRTLTAADYARTTNPSPATTSVIPAVKDEPVTPVAEAPQAPAGDDGTGRRASLRLNHVEPWSVARIAFAISVAMMIVGVVAMTLFWVVLNIAGVWDQVNEAVTSVLSDDSTSFDITDYLGFWRLIGLSLVVSAINVVLMTALATIGAHLYNLSAQVLGGVEVTFSEER